MWTIFKVFNESITTRLLLFIFWFSGHKAYGILAPQRRVKPAKPLHWEAKSQPLNHQVSPVF